jgi:tetratricopeptide (TPR) repeat protein
MKKVTKWLYVLILLLIAGCSGGAQVAAAGWQEQYDMGVRFLSESNYEEAVLAFTAAIEIDTKQPLAYVGRGDAYVGLGQYENAVPDYEQAITLDESVAEVYIKLADTYGSLGDPAAAEDALRRGYEATGDEAISILLGIEDEIGEETGDVTVAEDGGEFIILGTWRGEPLRWQVLAQEGDRALIITKDCVAVMLYQNAAWGDLDAIEGTTWENSSLRAWLNGSFYEEAFTGAEQERIQTTNVVNNDNSGTEPSGETFITDGGADTSDQLFLLSIEEANQHFANNTARVAGHKWTVEDVALVEEQTHESIAFAESVKEMSGSGQASWWLRSPGINSGFAATVRTNGGVSSRGTIVFFSNTAVRPAMWIIVE